MRIKAFFIMILALLAALIGAAQEAIVVYEGAITTHNVTNHPGNTYVWGMYKDFSPDIEADPSEFEFVTLPLTNQVEVRWKIQGTFYLKVTETDQTGCTNVKVLPVNVLPNEGTIGFANLSSSTCAKPNGNGFELSVKLLDNKGDPINSEFFPITTYFMFNGIAYSQAINFSNQELKIDDEWVEIDAGITNNMDVQITGAKDVFDKQILPQNGRDIHNRTFYLIPQLEFAYEDIKVSQGENFEHLVQLLSGETRGAEYTWKIIPEEGTSTDVSLIKGNNATILWDGDVGKYLIQVSVKDGNGCLSETISQNVEIVSSSDFYVNAGRDTTIGICNLYKLKTTVSDTAGVSYLWDPATDLDNPTSATPIFIPGSTTTFKVTATNLKGNVAIDSVKVSVSELVANAGDDILIEKNSSAILDGTRSIGENLQFFWYTNSGVIESGANTSSPIVSRFGIYYLVVKDAFDCVTTDSVEVSLITYAPIANDDYETVSYEASIRIPVLNNDYDPDGGLDSTSLTILQGPINGNVYVDYTDYTVIYTPEDGFVGNDIFEYTICNETQKCDNAHVYVVVNNFDFVIPNAFTPNGDNINDYFEIIGIEHFEGNSITIINRWGVKVYEARNYGIDTNPQYWNGKSNTGITGGNSDLPEGTYFYVLDLGNGQKPVAGSVYIDR